VDREEEVVLLSLRTISKHFEGTEALANVDLEVEPGTVHALVGENGAGKSTLAKIVAGAVAPDLGQMLLGGELYRPRTPLDAQRRGVGMIFQELDLFPHLTIADNLTIGNLQSERGAFLDRRAAERFCEPLLAEVGLDARPGELLQGRSIGQMQLVAIARALGMNARLLILDEPTSALDDAHAGRLFAAIARMKAKGVAMLYVSHKLNEVFRLADRITVLRDGRVVETTARAETDPSRVVSKMVGREINDVGRTPRPDVGRTPWFAAGPLARPVLSAKHLHSRKLHDITFDLHSGEILGIAGLVGSGRSSLAAGLFGLDPTLTGSILIDGHEYWPSSPAQAIANGLALVPEDRKTQGLLPHLSVLENSSLATLGNRQHFGFLRLSAERTEWATAGAQLRIRTASPDRPVHELSGGNQQKVLLARWLMAQPRILLLDDPTRGVDIGAKHDIYAAIRERCAAGTGVILISSELPELLQLSDRILVLNAGRAAGMLTRGEATEERVMELAAGVRAN
jgi:ABC-type sugar transport system ATPase subunit